MNTAHTDQLAAATRDARQTLADYAAARESRLLIQPGPVINRLAEEFVESLRQPVRVCPHVSTRSPMPLYARAHEPAILRCADCLATAARATVGTEEDYRCDGCGTLAPGAMHEAATLIGPVTLTLGLCHSCFLVERPA